MTKFGLYSDTFLVAYTEANSVEHAEENFSSMIRAYDLKNVEIKPID